MKKLILLFVGALCSIIAIGQDFKNAYASPLNALVSDSISIIDTVYVPSSGNFLKASSTTINGNQITIVNCYDCSSGFTIVSRLVDTIHLGLLPAGIYQCTLYSKEFLQATPPDPTIPCDSLPYRDTFNFTFRVQTPSGIENAHWNSLQIGPNPTSDKLYLNTDISDATISITDMTGCSYAVPHTGREIDVSALAAGVYVLRLQDRAGGAVRRFVRE